MGRYYDLPSISLRNVIWHAVKANQTFHHLRLHQLYYDRIHPSDHGHTILAHGLAHLFKRTSLLLEVADTAAAATAALQLTSGQAAAPTSCALDKYNVDPAEALPSGHADLLPRPMLPNVAGAALRRLECHDADSLRKLAEPPGKDTCDGWSYVVERSPSGVPKPGWLAYTPGAACTFTYAFHHHHKQTNNGTAASLHRIGIGYLKSYEHMGRVHIGCVHECECNHIVDAHSNERISPLDLQYFSATVRRPANTAIVSSNGNGNGGGTTGRCGIRLTVLNESSSGEHKFKLTALFLNRHGADSFFGRWIFSQAVEARARRGRRAGGGAQSLGRCAGHVVRRRVVVVQATPNTHDTHDLTRSIFNSIGDCSKQSRLLHPSPRAHTSHHITQRAISRESRSQHHPPSTQIITPLSFALCSSSGSSVTYLLCGPIRGGARLLHIRLRLR